MPEKHAHRWLKYLYAEPTHLLLNAMLAVGALAVALVAQYSFDKFPCELCLFQRWPYGAIAVVGVVAALGMRKHWRRHALRLIVLLFVVEAGLAFYHVGVEQAWWVSTSGCSGTDTRGMTLEELRAAILATPAVDCRDAGWRFLGITMATWNLVFALIMATLNGWGLLRRKAHAHTD